MSPSLTVRYPGNVALRDVPIMKCPGTVTAVVGRRGAGTSTLIGALAGVLPPHTQYRGRLPRLGSTLFLSDNQLPPLSVAETLRTLTPDVTVEAEQLGLSDYLVTRCTQLPVDLRFALHLAALRHRAADTILVDDIASAASPAQIAEFITLLRRCADDGGQVWWTDSNHDAWWSIADRVIELDHGHMVFDGPADTWVPTTVAEPTLLTYSRIIGKAPAHSPASLPQPTTLPAPTPHSLRSTAHIVAATAVGLKGPDLEFGRDECIGFVTLDGRPEPLARRIVAEIPDSVVSSSHTQHGRQTILTSDPRLVWAPHPQWRLDPSERNALADALSTRAPAPRLITTRDVEFLVRACHRIVIVDGDTIVQMGAPRAMLRHLPDWPLVAQAAGPGFLRLTDVIRSMEAA